MFFTKTSTVLVCLFGVYLLSSGGPPQVEAQSTGEDLVDALKKSFAELSGVLKETGQMLQDTLNKIVAPGLNLFYIPSIVAEFLVKLPVQTAKITTIIGNLVDSIRDIVTGNQPETLASLVGDGTPSNSPLGQGLSSITGLVGQLLQSLDSLLDSGDVFSTRVSRSVLLLARILLNGFDSLVGTTLKSAGDLIADGNESVVEPLIRLLNSVIQTSLTSVLNQIKALSSNSSGLLDTVGGILNSTLTQVQSLIGQLTDASSSTLRTALTDLASTLTGLIQTIPNQTQSG